MLDYATCPLKLSFENEGKILTRKHLFSTAARQSILAFFNTLAAGKSKARATSVATQEFSKVWLSYISTLNVEEAIDYGMTFPIEKVSAILEQSGIVMGTNFPIELALGKDFLLKDNIDIFIISTVGNAVTYRAIILTDDYYLLNKRYLYLRAALFKIAIQNYLGKTNVKRNCVLEVRSIFGNDKIIKPVTGLYFNLRKIVMSVHNAISNKVVYPTMNQQACKECLYRDICDQKVI